MKIAIPAGGFVSWGGGIDFVRLMLNGLLATGEHEVVLVLPRRTVTRIVRERLSHLRSRIRERVSGGSRGSSSLFAWEHRALAEAFADYRDRVTFAVYDGSAGQLRTVVRKLGADVVLPSLGSLGSAFESPWVGYVYDFQHKYFPQFFHASELRDRDDWFRRVLSEAPVVVANARSVRDDASTFFPELSSKVVPLPFAASPRPEWFELPVDTIRARYTAASEYFLVSNQFWLHKDHETAFRAFAVHAARRDAAEIRLVCTGVRADGRDPAYIGRLMGLIDDLGIASRIDFTGYVPKHDQIALMRGAIAVLQPTRFEGGPGGGAVWDAIAVGTPAIVSDIPVNLEIASEAVSCFKVGDPESLAEQMHRIRLQASQRPSATALLDAGARRLRALGATLTECAHIAVAARSRSRRPQLARR